MSKKYLETLPWKRDYFPYGCNNLRPNTHEGGINKLFRFEDNLGNPRLLREADPSKSSITMGQLENLYRYLDFFETPGNTLRLRSYPEQSQFSEILSSKNIKVPPVYTANEQILITEYVSNSTPLSELLKSGNKSATLGVKKMLETIQTAHENDIPIGDRWGPNELLSNDGNIYLIDFDLEVKGPTAKEFDMAFFLYHISYFAQLNDHTGSTLLPPVTEYLHKYDRIHELYNIPALNHYFRKFYSFHRQTDLYSWSNHDAADKYKDQVSKALGMDSGGEYELSTAL